MVREIQPEVVFFSDAGPDIRWCGNESGYVQETNWNTITPDTLYAGKPDITALLNTGSENGTAWIPAEVDVSIRPGWFYHAEEDSLVKSPETLFNIYLTSVGRGSNLLLNVPPDRRGLIHENDIAALKGFKALLGREFDDNLAEKSPVKADFVRGNSDQFAGNKTTDGDEETYWATDDGVTSGTLEIDLRKQNQVKYIVLQEYIKLGQRVKSFEIEVLKGDEWIKVAEGTTIGYKRIMKIDPLETSKIRISVKEAKACPLLSNVEVY